MKGSIGRTALMCAADNNHLECAKLLAPEEAGMRDNDGATAMMRSTKKGNIVSVLSPFEAGLTDNKGWNQTCYAIRGSADVIAPVRREKTVGWLLDGKTILETKRHYRLVSEEGKQEIKQNPLWMREIRLVGFQQKRHLQRFEAGTQMREDEDEEIRARLLD